MQSRGVDILYAANRASSADDMWADGFDRLATAIELNPLDGEYLFYSAYFLDLYEKASRRQSGTQPVADPSVTDFYRRALGKRPQAGQMWAQYAKSLFHSSNCHGRAPEAIERALKFAAYQPAVLSVHVHLGLACWDELGEAQRERLTSSVDYLLRHDPDDIIDAAVSNGLADKLRPLLQREEHIALLERATSEATVDRTADF